ncbi:MAG: tryptophan 2,3-dioxygenase family protein [Xanthomonadales bacterium]|nr:tryptophan 2,3-dioxygenase family protein [Xanthomonadales bacterium]
MHDAPTRRPLEGGIERDLAERLSYDRYLELGTLLAAQRPRSDPPHHDELLFIIQHQVAELWFKLILHELAAAIAGLERDLPGPATKALARIKQVQRQLFEMWAVLETLTPAEYMEFRHVLGPASGFQSLQYRLLEFLLGNKDEAMLAVFDHDPAARERLRQALEAPTLYDAFLRWLSRLGHPVPRSLLERDLTQPHAFCPELVPVLTRIYRERERHWDAYHVCESLVDLEENFQLWRFRHLKIVERIIGHKRGTGGSSGYAFLRQALELRFFPELIAVRTEL